MAEIDSKLPVNSEDMKAGLLAAMKRIESCPPRLDSVLELVSDDEWLSNDPDGWTINAGSSVGEDEIDEIDSKSVDAA